MKAIILAAGVGKRLWPVTQHRPKCLIQLGGRTLIHRYLEALGRVRVRRTTLVVGYKQEIILGAAVGPSTPASPYPTLSMSSSIGEASRHCGSPGPHSMTISSSWMPMCCSIMRFFDVSSSLLRRTVF